MYVSEKTNESKDWEQYTLIVPAVSVGNVGQLAVDLLISTLTPSLTGYFYTSTVLPIVGNDPFATRDNTKSCQLTTAVQVYESMTHKVVIVQQRAPCVKGKSAEYVSELIGWIESCRFKRVILLTSMFAHERRDSQLTGVQTRYLATERAKTSVESRSDRIQLESRPLDDFHPVLDPAQPFIPGGGIARQFYLKCSSADVDATILLAFCSEGDNVSDAVTLATYANNWLGLLPPPKATEHGPSMWKIPSSWRLQFGSHFDRTLF